MLSYQKITARFIAYCFVAVLFLFANHCFLEEACASLGKVDLGGHPVSDESKSESDPCHDNSSGSENESEACPILGVSLHKSITTSQVYNDLVDFSLEFSSWLLEISHTPISLTDHIKPLSVESDDLNKLENLFSALSSAPQAPPLS